MMCRVTPAGQRGADRDMGVDYSSAKKVIQHVAAHGLRGRVLMLGRHSMQVRDRMQGALESQLSAAGLDVSFADLEQTDGYAEQFFKSLGASDVVSMDISDFESAEIIHDLNDPVDESLHGQFDLIYDGGTTEHVFDVACCMDNINRMLAPGGVLIACSPGNNFFAHGFYQFGPELVYGYWKHGCGYDVLECAMLPEMPRDKEMPLPDPAVGGRRLRMRGKIPNQRIYLYYAVQKGPNARRLNRALQTDYVRRWSDFDKTADKSESDLIALRDTQAKAALAKEEA